MLHVDAFSIMSQLAFFGLNLILFVLLQSMIAEGADLETVNCCCNDVCIPSTKITNCTFKITSLSKQFPVVFMAIRNGSGAVLSKSGIGAEIMEWIEGKFQIRFAYVYITSHNRLNFLFAIELACSAFRKGLGQ